MPACMRPEIPASGGRGLMANYRVNPTAAAVTAGAGSRVELAPAAGYAERSPSLNLGKI